MRDKLRRLTGVVPTRKLILRYVFTTTVLLYCSTLLEKEKELKEKKKKLTWQCTPLTDKIVRR
jgi:hypothetical protein